MEVEFYLNDYEVHIDTFTSAIIDQENARTPDPQHRLERRVKDAEWVILPNFGLFLTFAHSVAGKKVDARIHIRTIASMQSRDTAVKFY